MMAKKILAVDDERSIVRLIQVNLERHGFQVVTAFDGKQGLEKVASEKPDMVVLDVMMPYMDGFEVLHELRKDPATRELPVIMLTAKANDHDIFQGYKSGADCYLTKPFNPLELINFVKRIFQAQEEEDDDRFEI
ncbi:MAG TPA: response regulator [Chthonomonadaceae bacterium]|nr:response regulator [Chthonomonadaceae bacterium]